MEKNFFSEWKIWIPVYGILYVLKYLRIMPKGNTEIVYFVINAVFQGLSVLGVAILLCVLW